MLSRDFIRHMSMLHQHICPLNKKHIYLYNYNYVYIYICIKLHCELLSCTNTEHQRQETSQKQLLQHSRVNEFVCMSIPLCTHTHTHMYVYMYIYYILCIMCISIYHYLSIYLYIYISISNLIYVQYVHISIDYRHKYEFTSHCQGSPPPARSQGLALKPRKTWASESMVYLRWINTDIATPKKDRNVTSYQNLMICNFSIFLIFLGPTIS